MGAARRLATVLLAGVAFSTAVRAGAVVEEWAARYEGTGNSDDRAKAVAVDASGNAYVTGESRGVSSLQDYATIKYDANGNELWAARYNGPSNVRDYALALAVDTSGNVYVTGYSYDPLTSSDYATIKYDANGNQLWAARYNGPDNLDDWAVALAVDASGNVYVTGESFGASTSGDYATIKYDAAGNQMWAARHNGPGDSEDYAFALGVDASGNVYVTGYSYAVSTDKDYATVKYDANGNQVWAARYDGPGSGLRDVAYALAVDASGNVYVTGTSDGVSSGRDYATVKYDTNGNQLWAARYDGPGNSDDRVRALAVDASGSVYVTGYDYGVLSGPDYATIKYDANGNQVWVARYDGPSYSDEDATALAVDASGNVYVTGYSCSIAETPDYATIKYSEPSSGGGGDGGGGCVPSSESGSSVGGLLALVALLASFFRSRVRRSTHVRVPGSSGDTSNPASQERPRE